LDVAQEVQLLSAIRAATMMPLPVTTIAITAPSAHPAPDVPGHQHTPSYSAMLLNEPNDTQETGSGGMSPAATPQSAIIVAGEPADGGPAHTAAVDAALAHWSSTLDPPHIMVPQDAQSFPAAIPPTDMAPNPTVTVQLRSLSGLADVPQADKALLQALGVTNAVPYDSVPPAALSNLIHAEAHTTAISAYAGSVSSIELMATPTPASTHVTATAAPSQVTTVTASVLVSTAAPGLAAAPVAPALSTAPDIATIQAIVQNFQALEIQPMVLVSDHGAIFYDAYAVNTQYSAVKSVTYDFGDGFSISLVGLPAELTHAGAHV
jgi:hypothetical protein